MEDIQTPPSPNRRREEQPQIGAGDDGGGDEGGSGAESSSSLPAEYVIFPDNADAEAAAIAAGKAKDNQEKMADQTFREALEELFAKFENKGLIHEIECPAWLDLPSFTGLLVKYRLRLRKKKNETKKEKKQRRLTNKHILGYGCLFSVLVAGIIILYYYRRMSSYDSIDQTTTNASSYADAFSVLSLLFNTTSTSLFGNSRNSHYRDQSPTASPITINVILIQNPVHNQQKNDEQHYYDHNGIDDEEGYYYGDFEL